MDEWLLSYYYYSANETWRGRLVQKGEYAAVIDVSHLYDGWTREDYQAKMASGEAERVWDYESEEELKAAAVRQWKSIGYLTWGGARLYIDGELASEIKAEGRT